MLILMYTTKSRMVVKALCGLILWGFIGISLAGETGDEPDVGEEPFLRHALGIFVGATHAEDEYLETLGIEYGYYINETVELGLLAERAVREDDSTLVIAFAAIHPYRGLILGAGVGRKDPGDNRQNTLRLSLGYEFEVSHHWSFETQLHLDFIENEEDEEVLGVALLRRF